MTARAEVVLDVDGVLAKFHERALVLIREEFGLEFSMEDYSGWDVTCLLERQEDKDRLNRIIREPGFATSLEPYPEAVRAVRTIRDAGAEVLFATSPNWFSETWMWERKLWLMRHFGAHEEEIAHIHRKHHLLADVFVDDKPSTVRSWFARHPGGKALLWSTPYNRSERELPRAESWEDVHRALGIRA